MNLLSVAVAPLDIYHDEARLSGATGFVIERDGRYFLATNRHIVTGKDNTTGSILDKQLALPNRVIAKIPVRFDKDRFTWVEMILEYENEKASDFWCEHDNKNVDIVLREFAPTKEQPATGIYQCGLHDFKANVTDTVFVIGYPAGLKGHKNLPLYKGGTISSEPEFDHDDLPRIIIDAATYSGMSGAPVVARSDVAIPTGKGGAFNPEDYWGAHFAFLGVYSGRLREKEEGQDGYGGATQLGVVWKKKTLDELVDKAMLTGKKT